MDKIIGLLDLENIISTISGIFAKIIDAILQFLPKSPFPDMLALVSEIPYLKELNWFLPIGEMLYVTTLWLGAIAIYYIYSAMLRFVRVIK